MPEGKGYLAPMVNGVLITAMIAKILRDNLVTLAKTYAKATGSTLAAVSKRFYGNEGFFADFRAGETSISIDKYDAVVKSFQAEWPKDREWPFLRAVVFSRPGRRG